MLSDEDVDRIARHMLTLKEQEKSQEPRQSREDTARELSRLLGPEYISFRQGAGSKVAYLEGHQVIALANEIFGYDGWSTEIRSRKVDYMDEKTGKICCSLVMRVTCKDGSYREDIGYGSVQRGSNFVTDMEKAGKEACTDALKRVLRQYGESLGNCLYNKSFMQSVRTVAKRDKDPVIDIDLLRRPKRIRPKSPPPTEPTNSERPTKRVITEVRSPRPNPLNAANNMLPPNPKPVTESTPMEPTGEPKTTGPTTTFNMRMIPPDIDLSSSPPDLSNILPPPLPKEPAKSRAPETPGFVSAAAIEKFDQTSDYGNTSFDAHISLGEGYVLDQTKSQAVRK